MNTGRHTYDRQGIVFYLFIFADFFILYLMELIRITDSMHPDVEALVELHGQEFSE